MAATASVSSYYICNRRINNLSFTHSSLSLTTNFPQRPISHKPLSLILNSQSFNLSTFPLHPPFASILDEIEASQDETTSELENSESEPETETFDEPQEENEEQNVTNSKDSGRLFVGNLPFSMTSSQLAEIFAEAGTVVSVDVSSFL